jgi:plastocyanin
MEIRAESDERLVIDGRPVTGARSFNQYSDGGQAIASLIQWLVPSAVVSERVPYAAFVAPGDTLLIDREDNVWSAIQDIADRIGAWVHHDGLGTFIIEPQPTLAGAATADFKVGVGGTITASESDFNREEFANTVAVTFQWYDGAQHTAYGYAEASTGPYSVAAIGRKVASVTIDRKGTANQAKAAAENMLKRAITRGRRLSIEVEHAPLWVRPGQTVTVQLVTGSQQRHFVKRIDFDIPSGRGHLSTRQPEDVSITTGE